MDQLDRTLTGLRDSLKEQVSHLRHKVLHRATEVANLQRNAHESLAHVKKESG